MIVFSSNSEIVIQKGPYTQLYANGKIVTHQIEVLIDIKFMNITVKFTVEDTNLTVYKIISEYYYCYCCMAISACVGNESSSTELLSTEHEELLSTENTVLIAAVGGAILLIVVVFTIVLVAVYTYKKKSKLRSC